MEKSSQMSMQNRTGMQMSPKHSKALLETLKGVDGIPPPPEGDGRALAQMRGEYISQAHAIGTIPPPPSVKGMAKAGAKMLTGKRPQVFLDKLAERAAFERGGTRLYDAILEKFRMESKTRRNGALPPSMSEQSLLEIRDQEADHFRLVSECVEKLGGDPTTQTPSADLVGVQSMGLLQAVSDPRTNVAQCLHSALAAELIDNAGWELLITLAKEMGHDDMVTRFQEALRHEEEHLKRVRNWYSEMTLVESGSA